MEKVNKIDFEEDRYCPVFQRIIACEWCYESLMGISKLIKKDCVRELDKIKKQDMDKALEICKKCKYSEL